MSKRMSVTVTDTMLADAVNAYVACHGYLPNREQRDKLRGILFVNGKMRCFDCDAPLAGGATAEYDHRNAGGGSLREKGIRARHEVAEMWAEIKAHGSCDVSHAAFLCSRCNKAKGDTPLTEWLNGPTLKWIRENR